MMAGFDGVGCDGRGASGTCFVPACCAGRDAPLATDAGSFFAASGFAVGVLEVLAGSGFLGVALLTCLAEVSALLDCSLGGGNL